VDDEIEHMYRQLKSELALLEKHRAKRRSRRELPTYEEPDEVDTGYGRHQYEDDQLAISHYAADEHGWHEEPERRAGVGRTLGRVAFISAMGLGVLLFAGAAAILLLPQSDQAPDPAAIADIPAADEPGITVRSVQPTPAATVLQSPASEPAEAPASLAPPSDFGDADTTPSAAPSAPQTPVAPAPLPLPEVRTANTAPATSEIRFAPTGPVQPAEPAAIPAEVSALVPSQRPSGVTGDTTQPLAFAPTAGPLPVEEQPSAVTIPQQVEPRRPLVRAEIPTPGTVENGVIDPVFADPLVQAEQAPPEPEPAPQPTSVATANSFVNMRAGPDNDQPVVTIVPQNARLEIIRCRVWCEVVYEGQRGFIFRDFVNRS